MPKYNGHKSFSAWNVCLWLYNDEPLYHLLMECKKRSKTKDDAAKMLLNLLPEKTPDGVKYSLTNVRLALRD